MLFTDNELEEMLAQINNAKSGHGVADGDDWYVEVANSRASCALEILQQIITTSLKYRKEQNNE